MQVQSLGQEDPLKKAWLPTPVFLPGELHGQRSLVGYSPWGHKESDTTEHTHTHTHTHAHTYALTFPLATGLFLVCPLPFSFFYGLPLWLSGKEFSCNAEDTGEEGSIPGLGRSCGGGHGNPLQCSYLENPMDRGAWQPAVYRVAKSGTELKRLCTHACPFPHLHPFCFAPSSSFRLPILKLAHVHQVGDAIQPSYLLSSPSPHAFNLSQHQGLFQ